jgi:hypothetical protein
MLPRGELQTAEEGWKKSLQEQVEQYESLSGDRLSFIRKLPQGAYKTLYLFYTFIILDWKFVGSNPQADYLN